MMESSVAVRSLSALAQESRLQVFRWLVECGPDGACPSDIAERLQIAPATLSFHLKALNHAGLVDAEQTGRTICYRANFGAMRDLIAYLSDNCCGGNPQQCAPKPAANRSRKT